MSNNYEDYECEEEEEERSAKESISIQLGDYVFNLKIYEFETDDTDELIGELKHIKTNKTVGDLEGYLINRRSWMSNFYTDCDSVSEELQLLGNVLFYQTGKIRQKVWCGELNRKEIEKASFGGFLYISKINIKKEYRGNDLGFLTIKHLLKKFKKRITLSVVVPGYLNIPDLNPEEQGIKHKNICKLFSRLGYKNLPSKKHCCYYYLVPSRMESRSKKDVENMDFLLPKKEVDGIPMLEELVSTVDDSSNLEFIQSEIRKYTDQGIDIDAGFLHMAAANGKKHLVKALIAAGADVNKTNELGDTSLIAVCRYGGSDAKEIVSFLLAQGADTCTKNKEDYSAYQMIIAKIYGSSCFMQTFDLKPRLQDIVHGYELARMIMPDEKKKVMVEGMLSPRMFKRIELVSCYQSDMARDDLRDASFVNRKRKYRGDIYVTLFEHVPYDVTGAGVYKSFVKGFVDVLRCIATIMGHAPPNKKLPTVSRILALLDGSWPPNYKFYLQNGGKVEYALKGIFHRAKESCWEYGDGHFEEYNMDSLLELPSIEEFDDDYQYVEIVLLDYLLNN